MHLAHIAPRIYGVFDDLLDKLNNLIFKDAVPSDADSLFIYSFKAFPSRLKSTQIDDWAKLQCKALSPFTNGDSYFYVTNKGLCFWASKHTFSGIPETAAQPKLEDGIHRVKGQKHNYRQVWSGGLMTSCDIVTDDHTNGQWDVDLQQMQQRGWAQSRYIDAWLSKPITWLGAAVMVALTCAIWLLSSQWALNNQLTDTQRQTSMVESQLGDKLALQSQFQQNSQLISQLNSWQFSLAHLPVALGIVIENVMQQASWQVNLIQWQERTLRVELVSTELNIAKLVTELENIKQFSNVSVRPNVTGNSWDLEVTMNEY